MCAHAHTFKHKHTHTHTHTCSSSYTHKNICKHTQGHVCMHTHKHTSTYMLTLNCCLHPLWKNSNENFARDGQQHVVCLLFFCSPWGPLSFTTWCWGLLSNCRNIFLPPISSQGLCPDLLQRFCWYGIWAWCFLIFQFLNSLPDLLAGGLFDVDWQGCFWRWYILGSSGAGRFNTSEKCSVHLLSCSWRLSLFVLDWLVCLLVSSCQLPGDVIQALHISLGCNFCLFCQAVNAASHICSYAFLSPLFELHCTLSELLPLLPWFGCLLVFSFPGLL